MVSFWRQGFVLALKLAGLDSAVEGELQQPGHHDYFYICILICLGFRECTTSNRQATSPSVKDKYYHREPKCQQLHHSQLAPGKDWRGATAAALGSRHWTRESQTRAAGLLAPHLTFSPNSDLAWALARQSRKHCYAQFNVANERHRADLSILLKQHRGRGKTWCQSSCPNCWTFLLLIIKIKISAIYQH